MVTRESTLRRETFDPVVFHRSATMAQSGWAEREIRLAKKTFQDKIGRFASSITFALGALLILAVRPPNIMDGRDLSVSAVALGASLVVGMVGSKLVMSFFRTSVEVDRIVMWAISLLAGLVLASTGLIPAYARDADDYIHEIPGHTLTIPTAFDAYNLVDEPKGVFADAEVWSLEAEGSSVGAVGVYVIDEGSKRGVSKMMSEALGKAVVDPRRAVLAGTNVFVTSVGTNAQIGYLADSALIVVSGPNRSRIEPAATALIAKD